MPQLSGVQQGSAAAISGNHLDAAREDRSGLLIRWMLAVLVLWSVAHSLNRWVLQMDGRSSSVRFAWWTTAALIAWLLPTLILLRRSGGASARWLGVTTTKGLALALLWAGLWIALQEAGCRLHLPLFARPAADLSWYSLASNLVVAPLFEEGMFRGAMLRTMREARYTQRASVLACALAFALLHVPGWIFRRGLDPSVAGSFAAAWGFGMVAGFLAWRTPSLWSPIFLHWTNNLWSTGALAWLVERIIR